MMYNICPMQPALCNLPIFQFQPLQWLLQQSVPCCRPPRVPSAYPATGSKVGLKVGRQVGTQRGRHTLQSLYRVGRPQTASVVATAADAL